ncbi:hypothetical protein BDP81DRAFT_20410 [Colletotrichum phormii]|uniref:Uncharacterized protein n=1 Tax=Colletotrichum phormii TaxID=359342 RepID=A0AAJ0EKF3_9PEZI|nr:uncharacterized protein BDP81DRAFT_20410 [Colletotrichum phormii]KAK1656370.1 hypothetical protein BDP81DRAFT_20410 [Colletotrichum phormii]
MTNHRSSESSRKSSRKTTTSSASSPYGPGQPFVTTQYNGWPATAPVYGQAVNGQQYIYSAPSSTSTPQHPYTDSTSQPSWDSSSGSQGGMQYSDPTRDADVASSRRECAEHARKLQGTTQTPSAYRLNHQQQLTNFDQTFGSQPSTTTQPFQSRSPYAQNLEIDSTTSQSSSRRDDRRGGSSSSGSKHHSSSSRRHK